MFNLLQNVCQPDLSGGSALAEHGQAAGAGEGARPERLPLSGNAVPLSGLVPAEPHPPRGGHGRVWAGSQTFLGDAHLSSGSSQGN